MPRPPVRRPLEAALPQPAAGRARRGFLDPITPVRHGPACGDQTGADVHLTRPAPPEQTVVAIAAVGDAGVVGARNQTEGRAAGRPAAGIGAGRPLAELVDLGRIEPLEPQWPSVSHAQ